MNFLRFAAYIVPAAVLAYESIGPLSWQFWIIMLSIAVANFVGYLQGMIVR